MHPTRSPLALGLGLLLALGAAAGGCGPQEKFCPDSGDGVCRPPPDAHVSDVADTPPMEMGSIFVGADAGTD
jgi:hypothetical protein